MKIASVSIPRVTQALAVSDFLVITAVLASATIYFKDLDDYFANGAFLVNLVKLGLVGGFVTFFLMACNFAMGLYQRRYMRGRKLVTSAVFCAAIGFLALLFMDNLFLENTFVFSQILVTQVTMYTLMAVLRPIVCNLFQNFVPKRRLAFIGSASMAEQVRFTIASAFPADAEIVDCIDWDANGEERATLATTLRMAGANPDIDDVFVEMPELDLRRLVGGTASGHSPMSTGAFYNHYARWVDFEMIDPAETEAIVTRGHSSFWIKRILETFVSALILIFFAPIMLFTIAAIKLEDGGSLFYRQTRVGKMGKHFSVLKFRSMVENAEREGSPQWAVSGDSRVTRVGRFLRKSRIDELPQLLNIIRGDMALVGPRPERPEFVAELAREIPNFELRHMVRPGLTGWAQISYPYGASIEDARWKTRFDLYYINNWTIWFDCAIIAQTVRVVLLAEGSR